MMQSNLSLTKTSRGEVTRLVLTVAPGHTKKIRLLEGIRKSKAHPGRYYIPPEPSIAYKVLEAFEEGELQLAPSIQQWFETFQDELKTSLDPSAWSTFNVPIPATIDHREYQLTGAAWLHQVGRGILGDPMGIGKTIQALLACLLHFKTHPRENTKVLVVCPKEVAIKWAKACSYFLGLKGVACVFGDRKRRSAALAEVLEDDTCKFVIINYEMLNKAKYPTLFTRGLFDIVIPDEAHNLQGRNSLRSKSMYELVNKVGVECVMMLTGSPISNRLDSLWSLLHILYPKRFSSYWGFVRTYCVIDDTPFGPKVLGPDPSKLEELQWIVGPLLLVRDKNDVLPELPKVTHVFMDYVLDDRHEKEYREILYWMRSSEGVMNISWLRRYLIMRDEMVWVVGREGNELQIPRKYNCSLPNVKMQHVMSYLEEAFNEKAIIFVYHRDVANFVARYIQARFEGQVFAVSGEFSDSERHERLTNFVETDEPAILVGTLSTIGTGLDLQVADLVIFVEHSYQSEDNNQAVGRVERIGQKGHPIAAHFIGQGTVEQAVYEVADEKDTYTTQVLAMDEIKKKTLELLVNL